ncbi:MAG: hypothetical protein WA741_33405 [Candidatus Sulfotelmatobacter sp.]
MKLKLQARINRSDARTIRQALDQLAAKGSVKREGDEFLVEAEMEGTSALVAHSLFRGQEKRTIRDRV